MKTVIEMAREAGFFPDWNWDRTKWHAAGFNEDFERFAELVRADERNRTWTQEHWTEYEHGIRNATLDEIATKIEAMPFGDTAASFAVWIREQKT